MARELEFCFPIEFALEKTRICFLLSFLLFFFLEEFLRREENCSNTYLIALFFFEIFKGLGF